jgi:cellulose synthase/poly-beta-1,6-N-acetylglucosamine synthase-like glycosyltransferase
LSKKYRRVDHKPKTTILIAARNEEGHLPDCLDSFQKQSYPSDLLQIIVLNDRSTDATRQIVLDSKKQLPNLELLDIIDDQNGLKGKMNALAQGMDKARGEIILITDADCRVPGTWVSEMVAHFTENVGLVGGLTLINHSLKKSHIFDRIQTLDWFFLQAIAAGTAGLKLPVSVLGNNFGYTKSAYDQVGGFRRIGFSLTEDMALLNAIVKNTDCDIVYQLRRESMIQSLPLNHIRDFFGQRKRWLSGGLGGPIWGWVLMLASFMVHFLILMNLSILNFTLPVLSGLILTFGIDLSIVWRMVSRSGFAKLKRYFIQFEIFYFFYTIILALNALIPGKIFWKGRSYNNGE